MKIIYYQILATEHGQAIQCGRCNMISYNINDVEQRYCGACKLFLNDIDGPLPPLTLGEFQIIYNRLYRFLLLEQQMRDQVFPAGHAKRMVKMSASIQACADLVKIKDILKQQFAIAIPDPDQRPEAATQPPLIEVPVSPKQAYQ